MGYSVSVLGASGYAGAELLRILHGHTGFEVVAAAAGARAGTPVASVHPWLRVFGEMEFVDAADALGAGAELVFSSLPHTHSMELFAGPLAHKVVDLAGDFRLRDPAQYEVFYGAEHPAPETLGDWTYGLAEFRRDEIAVADKVANPGCYPAAVLLAMGPLLAAGLVATPEILVSAASGVSGAGRASGEGFDFAQVSENYRPYSVVGHKHIPEMEQELSAYGGSPVRVSFVPHLAPMVRGIVVTCMARSADGVGEGDLMEALQDRYRDEPFVRVLSGELPETKRLRGTNLCEVAVRLDERSSRVLAFGALDNLGKGAAGSAVQNANLMFGLPEAEGLGGAPVGP